MITQEKTKAEQQKEIAVAAETLAKENETIAKRQADLALSNLQTFINTIDVELARDDQFLELRLKLLGEISAAWDQIDKSTREDKFSEAIPTRMGARFRIAQAYMSAKKFEMAYNESTKLLKRARSDLFCARGLMQRG